MPGGQEQRSARDVDKRTPLKSTPRGFLSMSEVYPGSGMKVRPKQSMRTPQQHLPLKLDDRTKRSRASNSFVVADLTDMDTPRTNIQAFMEAAGSVEKVQQSAYRYATKRRRSLQAPDEVDGSVFKAPRVRELAASDSKTRISSPGSKLTPRSNVWSLLQTGQEKTPVERTVILGEPRSPGSHTKSSVRNAGQRVSVSPITVSSLGAGDRSSTTLLSKTSARSRRKSFHLSSADTGALGDQTQSLSSVAHSGQRVSVSPINVSDHRIESEDLSKHKRKAARRSFHLDMPQIAPGEISADDEAETDLTSENNDSPADDAADEAAKESVVVVESNKALEEEEEDNNRFNIQEDVEIQSRVNDQSLRGGYIEGNYPSEELNAISSKTSMRTAGLRVSSREMVVDNIEFRAEAQEEFDNDDGEVSRKTAVDGERELLVDNLEPQAEIDDAADVNVKQKEASAPAVIDPASVYDLSEGSSSSRLETSGANRSKRSSGSTKRLSSGKKKTPGTNSKHSSVALKPSSQRPPSSKRKRLNFSEVKRAETQNFESPLQEKTMRNSPRSSTPLNRSVRFFHSAKIQRSMTEYFQGDRDLSAASTAITPRTKDLFSNVSPIRRQGALHEADEQAEPEDDLAADLGNDENDDEELLTGHASKSQKVSGIDLEDKDHGLSQEPDGELFSSLDTPHIDLRKRVFASSLQKKQDSVKRSKVGKIPKKAVKPSQPKRAAKQVTNLPRATLKYFADLHSDMKLSTDAIDELEKVSEQFWANTCNALEAYAMHAGRKSVQEADVILLMKTQRLISDTDDLHHKIRKLMPMELQRELIPCAYLPQRRK